MIGALIREFSQAGVIVELDGDNLEISAPDKPPDELIAKLKANKAELVAILRQAALATCPKGYSQEQWLAAVADARRLRKPNIWPNLTERPRLSRACAPRQHALRNGILHLRLKGNSLE